MGGNVVVAGGAGDNAAAACGIGAIRPGEGFVSLGTSGVLFVSNDRFRPNTAGAVHAFCHAIPNTWHQMGVILSATDSLNWLSHVTGKTQAELSGAAEAQLHRPGRGDLPALSLGRAHAAQQCRRARQPSSASAISAITARLAQAVMEGVTFAFRDCQRVLTDAGTTFGRLLAVGGGSQIGAVAQNASPPISTSKSRSPRTAISAARSAPPGSASAPPKAPTPPRS